MAKLDRLLGLVHALSETTEGMTLDEMAERLSVNRRTAERMRERRSLVMPTTVMVTARAASSIARS